MRWGGASRRRRVLWLGLVLALVVGGLTFLVVGRSSFAWDKTCTLARRQLPGLLGADRGCPRREGDEGDGDGPRFPRPPGHSSDQGVVVEVLA